MALTNDPEIFGRKIDWVVLDELHQGRGKVYDWGRINQRLVGVTELKMPRRYPLPETILSLTAEDLPYLKVEVLRQVIPGKDPGNPNPKAGLRIGYFVIINGHWSRPVLNAAVAESKAHALFDKTAKKLREEMPTSWGSF